MWKERSYHGLEITGDSIGLVRARPGRTGCPEILGGGAAPLEGIRKGRLVSEEQFLRVVRNLLEEAASLSRRRSGPVVVALDAHYSKVTKLRGTLLVPKHQASELVENLKRILEDAARNKLEEEGRTLLRVIPISGEVLNKDDEEFVHVDTEALIISADQEFTHKLARSLKKAGLHPAKFVFGPVERAFLLASDEEREYGVNYVEIGARSSTILTLEDGTCQFAEVLNLGSELITSDVSFMLQTGTEEARRLIQEAEVFETNGRAKESLHLVASLGSGVRKRVTKAVVDEIAHARMVEILLDCKGHLQDATEDRNLPNISIFGGTITQEPGAIPFIQRVFEMPVGPGSVPGFTGEATVLEDPRHYGALAACLTFPDFEIPSNAAPMEAQGL